MKNDAFTGFRRRLALCASAISIVLVLLSVVSSAAFAQQLPEARVTIPTYTADPIATAIDAGPLPSGQRISLVMTLAIPETRAAALQQYISDLTVPNSGSYHRWLTPAQFASAYGATSNELSAAQTWVRSQGLTVDSVSPSGMRLSVSGSTTQLQSAFAVNLHVYQVEGVRYFASTSLPSLPSEFASLFSAIEGLDTLPLNNALSATYLNAKTVRTEPVIFSSLASIIDENSSPVITLDSQICTKSLAPAQLSEYTLLFRQASAQGITVLAGRGCTSGSFPAALPEITAVSLPGSTADTTPPVSPRPSWQAAVGLPSDALRHAPDLTVSSLASFAQTITGIEQEAGSRLGNINATLYSLAPIAGLYTQPDSGTNTWEPATGLGLVDQEKLLKVFPHGTGGSTFNFYSSNGAPIHGQTFTLTATLISAIGGAQPTGSVTISATQSAFPTGSFALDSNGSATSTAYQLPGGTYNITVTYPGDANYAANSASLTLTVSPEAAGYTITAPATATLGSTVNPTITLTSVSGFGTPNANATITPFGIANSFPANVVVTGNNGTATASAPFVLNRAGSVTFQASCFPIDQNFTCSGNQNATTVVAHVDPVTTLTINPAAPAAGASVTLTAVVATTGGIAPTGTVNFFDGGTQLGSGTAPNATYTTTLAPGTSHSLYATYVGDSNYNLSNSNTVTPTVSSVPTTTTVSPSAPSIMFGQQLTLAVKIVPSTVVNGTQPTGAVTITGAGATTINATANGGAVSVPILGLPVGTYTIATNYAGDSNYAASVGNTVTVTVTPTVGSLMTQISSNSFTTGSTATLTVTVTLPNDAQLPAGSTFVANILTIPSAVYTGTFGINPGGNTGTGQVTIPAPIAGSYTLQVTCPGNASFSCTPASIPITSTSTTGPSPTSGTVATTTTLTSNPSPPVSGQSVTLTATVSAPAAATAANAIAGTVTFYDGTTPLGSPVVVTTSGSNGVASTVVALSVALSHSLTAVYSGNTIYGTSTSPAIAIGSTAAQPAAITLKSNVTNGTAGLDVVLTANVTGITSAGVAPTGTVSFYRVGSTPTLLGTVTLTSGGTGLSIATFSSTSLPSGSLTVYAVYSGDGNFASVTSSNITVGISDYAVTFVAPAVLNLTQGQSGTVQVLLTDLGGYAGTVTLSCMPPVNTGITCAFNPDTLTTGGNTTLTVLTTAAKASAVPPSLFRRNLAGGISLAALICLLLPGRSRRRLSTLLLAMLALGLSTGLGCGGTSGSILGIGKGGTPFGTSILTINTAGSDGTNTIHHNYSYQVTVQ